MNSTSEDLEQLAQRQRAAMDAACRAVLEFEAATKALAAANARLASALNTSRSEAAQSGDWHQPDVASMGSGIMTRLEMSVGALRREAALATRIADVTIAPKPAPGQRQPMGSRYIY